jgi:hypothetical protein
MGITFVPGRPRNHRPSIREAGKSKNCESAVVNSQGNYVARGTLDYHAWSVLHRNGSRVRAMKPNTSPENLISNLRRLLLTANNGTRSFSQYHPTIVN